MGLFGLRPCAVVKRRPKRSRSSPGALCPSRHRRAARGTLEKLALNMRDSIDAINLTDNQRGVGRMSALGAGVIMQQLGIEPIVQMTCQHRNRIALQADVLSGAACGRST